MLSLAVRSRIIRKCPGQKMMRNWAKPSLGMRTRRRKASCSCPATPGGAFLIPAYNNFPLTASLNCSTVRSASPCCWRKILISSSITPANAFKTRLGSSRP